MSQYTVTKLRKYVIQHRKNPSDQAVQQSKYTEDNFIQHFFLQNFLLQKQENFLKNCYLFKRQIKTYRIFVDLTLFTKVPNGTQHKIINTIKLIINTSQNWNFHAQSTGCYNSHATAIFLTDGLLFVRM